MLAASILKPPSVVPMIAPGSAGGQGRVCEWSRCLVLQTSYESELLQVAHAVMDSSRTTQINVFIVRVPVSTGESARCRPRHRHSEFRRPRCLEPISKLLKQNAQGCKLHETE